MKRDVAKARAWRRRGAEVYEARRRERDQKPLERKSELARMSRRKLDELAARGRRAPGSSLNRSAPKRRPPTEAEVAREWHKLGCRGRLCVKSGRPAGPHAHHGIPQHFLKSLGLEAHLWDLDNAVPVTLVVHMNHEARADPITREELKAAGVWDRLVQWARWLDSRYFLGAHPVESRLERDYPASTRLPTEATNEGAD